MAQTSVMFQRSHKQTWVLPVSVPGVVVAEGVDVEGAEEDSLQGDVEGADQAAEGEGALPEAGRNGRRTRTPRRPRGRAPARGARG